MDDATTKEVEKLHKKLRTTIRKITTNHSADPALMSTDVTYCGLMEMSYLLRWQIAELENKPLDAIDFSKQAAEWSRRKAASVSAQKNDLLQEIITRLDQQDAIAEFMRGVE